MRIRPATIDDTPALADVLEPIVRAGETFAFPRDWSREEILRAWIAPGHAVRVAEEDGRLLGTSFVKRNQLGPGDHVANAGYATAVDARGRGVARALCLDSLERAREAGFTAMQFNLVVSTNAAAIRVWMACGFETLARIPGAFRHPTHGPVDALVMFRTL